MKHVAFVACVAGLGAGAAAAWLSTVASARLGDNGFWRRLTAVARLLVSPDEEGRFFREYVRLWPALAGFAVKKLAVTAIAVLPIVLAFSTLTVLAGGVWTSDATSDWEFDFLIAVCAAGVLGLIVPRRLRPAPPTIEADQREACLSGAPSESTDR